MSFSSSILRGFAVTLLMLSFSMLTFADTLRLKSGSIIKGRIVSFGSGKFVVSIGEGARQRQLTYAAGDIESIQFDSPTQVADASDRNTLYIEPAVKPTIIIPTKVIRNEEAVQTASPQPKSSGEKMKPIEWRVKVTADSTANGWTNSGWVVKKGQRIRINGDGTVALGRGQNSTATGLPSLNDERKLLKSVPTGALIAVIGDDNNDFIYIGAEREFTATRDGALFLGINEGYLDDNSGAYNVKIEILPDDGQ